MFDACIDKIETACGEYACRRGCIGGLHVYSTLRCACEWYIGDTCSMNRQYSRATHWSWYTASLRGGGLLRFA